MYLGAASCISFQNTFGNQGCSENPWNLLETLTGNSALIQPNYKEFVKPAQLRRMSSALKMGVAGGKRCLQQAKLQNCNAISVATGLGCVRDTLKFLSSVYHDKEAVLSPTAFIQSTHNSIAGQLALMLGNHGYNMTHVQGACSLGYALSDAELLLAEGDAETVLVGAVDEKTQELEKLLQELANKTAYPLPPIGEGAAFFLASKRKLNTSVARVVQLELSAYNHEQQPYDLLFSNTTKGFNYAQFSGTHFTAVGFGLFLALKALEAGEIHNQYITFDNPKRIWVEHRLLGQEMSILLEKV